MHVDPRRLPPAPIGRSRTVLAGLVAVVVGLSGGFVAPPAEPASAAPAAVQIAAAAAPDERPNILLITSDDQADFELDYMPKTNRLLAANGVDFTDGINPHPLCCPARAEILTGEYGHNNGVLHNIGRWGGYRAFLRNGNRNQQIGRWLHDAGYRTGFTGKMMNGYRASSPRPRGFTRWNPTLRGTYSYYGTEFLEGRKQTRYPDTYVADVVRDKTNAMVRRWSDGRKPFFIWASHVGPHISKQADGPPRRPIPAKRHEGTFEGIQSPTKASPSFAPPTEVVVGEAEFDRFFQARVESLQAIDEANASTIRLLMRTGEFENTVVVYVSDNGYQLGEHGFVGKNFSYQENLQVPFLAHGPGLPEGVELPLTPSIVDLAPTFLQYAGVLDEVRRSGHTDGTTLQDVLAGSAGGNDTTLVQAGWEDEEWKFRGVRTSRYTYVEYPNADLLAPRETYDPGGDEADPFAGEFRLFDRGTDPFEENNLLNPRTGRLEDPRYAATLAELQRRYGQLKDCQGVEQCELREYGPVPPPR